MYFKALIYQNVASMLKTIFINKGLFYLYHIFQK